MENPVSFMADIVIVYIYASPMNHQEQTEMLEINTWSQIKT